MDAVEAKHDVLLRSLEKFYDECPEAFEMVRSVLSGKTDMSLRVLDWLVTNYCKKRNIVYQREVNSRKITVNMYLHYKSQLKAYSKKHFDPFCRVKKGESKRVMFRGLETTCGQLNFFRWAMRYGVLEYALQHHDEIEADMDASTMHRHQPQPHSAPSKRRELSKAAVKTCTMTLLKVKLKLS